MADRGINSKINLKKIRDRGYDYIFASRLKNLKKEVRQEIFNDDYQKMGEIHYQVINYINKIKEANQIYELPEELIITYSPQRAEKDRKDRERLIKKARSLLQHKSSINASNKRGGKNT